MNLESMLDILILNILILIISLKIEKNYFFLKNSIINNIIPIIINGQENQMVNIPAPN